MSVVDEWPARRQLASLVPVGMLAGALFVVAALRLGPHGSLIIAGAAALVTLFLAVQGHVAAPLGVIAVFAAFSAGKTTFVGAVGLVELTIAGLVIVVVLTRLGAGLSPLPWSSLMWWPLGLLAWTLVALSSTLDLTPGLKQVAQLVAGLAFAAVVLAACRDLADLRIVLGGLVAMASVVVAWGLATLELSAFTTRLSGVQVEGRLQASFNQPNELGAFCAIIALVAVGMAFGARTVRGRLAARCAVVVLLIGLMLSLSRGAWIGFVVGIAFLIVTLAEARRALVVAVAPLLLVAATVGSFGADRPEVQAIELRTRSLTALSPYDGRQEIWAEAKRQIVQDPVTGVGPGNFQRASRQLTSESTFVSAVHAHNLWLNWAAETGLPAAAILLGFVVALIIAGRRVSRTLLDRRDRALALGVSSALVSLLAHGIFDYPYRNEVLFFAIWAILGGAFVFDREARRLRMGWSK